MSTGGSAADRRIILAPLQEADLELVLPWFDDADTQRWLGGRDWPRQALDLAKRRGRYAFLVMSDDRPVGLLDVELYTDRRAGFAYIVAPELRRQGFASAALEALDRRKEMQGVIEMFAGIEAGNIASECLLLRLGYTRVRDEDAEGFSYFARPRDGYTSEHPWKLPVD